MASRSSAKRGADWRVMLKRSILRAGQLLGAMASAVFVVFLALALLDYHESDPSLNTAGGDAANVMGVAGAYTASLTLFLFGLGVVLFLPLIATFARRLWIDDEMTGWGRQVGQCVGGVLLVGTGLDLIAHEMPVGLPAGRGGLLAQLFGRQILHLTGMAPDGWSRAIEWLLILLLVFVGLVLSYKSWRLERICVRLDNCWNTRSTSAVRSGWLVR